MSTYAETPVTAPAEERDPAPFPELSRGASVGILLVAFIGTILTTIDLFLNGWLAALAHLGWFIGVFLVTTLALGFVLTLLLNGSPGHIEASPGTS
ncbi:hypothetical protein OG215_36790 (plasmid) [Streptomyces globisporus]|uniref:hypothetical protein n=1 Tax=Streptomyces globisporus TaxID=1908 RepID=UPI002F91875A|nr:hypothetical protein OG215_36790 [Streptomyces globisporus]